MLGEENGPGEKKFSDVNRSVGIFNRANYPNFASQW
jgi:hypothetical protein